MSDIENLNLFCELFKKLDQLHKEGKRLTEEYINICLNMNCLYQSLPGKMSNYLDRYIPKLADLGYFIALSQAPKIDISDLEFDEKLDINEKAKISESKYRSRKDNRIFAVKNYHQDSVSFNDLPDKYKRELVKKTLENMKATQECIEDPNKIQINKKAMNNLGAPKLSDYERDW